LKTCRPDRWIFSSDIARFMLDSLRFY